MSRSANFSRRAAFDRHPNRLAQALERAKQAGREVVDLTASNPTQVGLSAPAELLRALSDPAAARYEPAALGTWKARCAVAEHLRRRGRSIAPDRIVLTASSSESYSWLFKLLADPNDQVLYPQPSYPLLPLLAQLEAVQLCPYPLIAEEGWRVDLGAVERAMTARTRAIVLVHPNNPTGSLVRRDDARALAALAAEAGAALVVDEVFGDYLHRPPAANRQRSFVGFDGVLCFVLDGLSKLALLPQLKLGWIACSGPDGDVAEALGRLEVVADSYLSVGTPVQEALPSVLAQVDQLQAPVHERLKRNLHELDLAIERGGSSCPLRRLPVEGGWYAMIEIPRTRSDDEWVELLAEQEGLVVHPGYFFDLDRPGVMVVSLLLEPDRFASAVARAMERWVAG